MEELRLSAEIIGIDRVLYREKARWDKCTLSMKDASSAIVEIWESDIDTHDKLVAAINRVKSRLNRLVLSIEWALGRELYTRNIKIQKPRLSVNADMLEISVSTRINVTSTAVAEIQPKQVPKLMPEVPIEAERWVKIWVEACKFGDYVEEQIRRHYLIIEELWDEFRGDFDDRCHHSRKQIKLIRDFVSHANCDNKHIIALVEPNLKSAVVYIKGDRRVAFQRTVEHRNYVAQFEAKSRELAHALIDKKMHQFGVVSGV